MPDRPSTGMRAGLVALGIALTLVALLRAPAWFALAALPAQPLFAWALGRWPRTSIARRLGATLAAWAAATRTQLAGTRSSCCALRSATPSP